MSASNDDIAVKVQNVHKTFKLPHEKTSGIKQAAVGLFNHGSRVEKQHVLDGVSFEIKQGEFFGIVGRNGSGKSTLLKLLAGIYTPDSGSIEVNGALTPFIELGVGFNPELTGRENVFLNGALLGFSQREMLDMYDEIVAFAELHRFMDQKLKNYSSGMQVRLAFSIAIRANTPILLIDEVLAVGDSKFQNKCYAEFRKMKRESKTIILVTHDMSAVERFCDRVLVLQSGEVMGIYTPMEAAVVYERMNADVDGHHESKSNRWGSHEITIENVSIYDGKEGNRPTRIVNQGSDVKLHIKLKNHEQPRDITVGLAFHDTFGTNVSGPNSSRTSLSSGGDVIFTMPKLALVPGEYIITVVVFDENSEHEYDHIEEAAKFTVVSDILPQYGKINLFGSWSQ